MNAERNQRVSRRTMCLRTSFSTVCVKNPADGRPDTWISTCPKNGREFFCSKNQRLRVRFVRLRTILSTKNVKKEGVVVGLNLAYFLDLEISLSKIKYLPMGNLISHKFIHRNCGQLHANRARWLLPKFVQSPHPDLLCFYAWKNIP